MFSMEKLLIYKEEIVIIATYYRNKVFDGGIDP